MAMKLSTHTNIASFMANTKTYTSKVLVIFVQTVDCRVAKVAQCGNCFGEHIGVRMNDDKDPSDVNRRSDST